MTTKDNPHTYLHFINQHQDAYRVLKEKYPSPIDLFFVKAYLLGRIIELILKAELIIKGYSSDDLKKKQVGNHDLLLLLTLLGFPNTDLISPIHYESITHLNKYYKGKRYEYPTDDEIEIKNISFLEEFINLSISKLKFRLQNNP